MISMKLHKKENLRVYERLSLLYQLKDYGKKKKMLIHFFMHKIIIFQVMTNN
jgi:hypothetical protein